MNIINKEYEDRHSTHDTDTSAGTPPVSHSGHGLHTDIFIGQKGGHIRACKVFSDTAERRKAAGLVALDGRERLKGRHPQGHRMDETQRDRRLPPVRRGRSEYAESGQGQTPLPQRRLERRFPVRAESGRLAGYGCHYRKCTGLELDRRNVGEAGGCDKETRMEVNRHQRRQDFRATS